MPNQFQRIDRISEEVRREVDRIIRDELNDPRITGTWSITRAEVTRDLRYAKLYISVLEDENRKPLLEALKKAAGFIRRSLGHNMIIRYSPELIFVDDHNIEYGAHIAGILNRVGVKPAEEEDSADGE